MKSNKCGYDFANRDDKTGECLNFPSTLVVNSNDYRPIADFLTRQFATSDQARRKAQKHLEADYEVGTLFIVLLIV
jgi:phage terminase large subunit-like protein